MRSKTIWIVCLVSCVAALGSKWALAQTPVVVTRDAGHLLTTDASPVMPESGESVLDQIKLYPVTTDTMYVVSNESGGVSGADDKLIYDNPLASFAAEIPANQLVSDDIKVAVGNGCALSRYRLQIIGKAGPRSCGAVGTPCGPLTVNFQLFNECPNAGGLPIAGTEGCASSDPARPDCIPLVDSESLFEINVTPYVAVTLPSAVWLGVKMSRAGAGVILGTPPQLGFSGDVIDFLGFACNASLGGFPRNPHASFNASIYGAADCPGTCLTYQNIRAANSGINPGANTCIADDIQLNRVCDMVEMEIGVRNKGLFDVELRQSASSRPIGGCSTGTVADFNVFNIPGTWKRFLVSQDGLAVRRFLFNPPIHLPAKNIFAVLMINNPNAQWILTRRNASIGETTGSYWVFDKVAGVWSGLVPSDNSHGGLQFTITCAGECPLGACCDQYVRDAEDEAVCRDLAQINCPFPQKNSGLKPSWAAGIACRVCEGGLRNGLNCADDADCAVRVCVGGTHPGSPCTTDPDCGAGGTCPPGICVDNDPFLIPCGLSACCRPDGNCSNLTKNRCSLLLPLDAPRVWDLGQYCSIDGQRCPNPKCLEQTGDCLNCSDKLCNGGPDDGSTCFVDNDCGGSNDGICIDITPHCVGGDLEGAPCFNDLDCIPGGLCVTRTCSGGARAGSRCAGQRDCAESFCEGHPGCSDPFCCDRICSDYDVFCCDIDWDCQCASVAQRECDLPPDNDKCAPGDRTGGALRVFVDNPYVQTNHTKANVESTDGYCCNGGLRRCDGGCTDGDQCADDLNCTGRTDGYCNFTLEPPSGVCTAGCNAQDACLGGPNNVNETVCVGGARHGQPCKPRCVGGARAGLGCAVNGDCPSSTCSHDIDCPSGICDNSFCEGAANGTCADPVPEPGKPGYGSVWYYFTVPTEAATETVDIEVSTCGSSSPALDSMLQVYAIADSNRGLCYDLGRCSDGSDCRVSARNCGDASACVARELVCSVSAQDCPQAAECRLDRKTACGSLSVIGCNDDAPDGCGTSSQARNSKLCLSDLVRGNTYYVVVSAKTFAAQQGVYKLRVNTVNSCSSAGAPNDFCVNAITLEDGNADNLIVEPFNLATATFDCKDLPCNNNLRNDLWYHVTAPFTGQMAATTCGTSPATSPDTEMMIYTGCTCPAPRGVAPACASVCNDANCFSSACTTFNMVEGECYTIRLADNGGGGGSGNLKITFVEDCGNGTCEAVKGENCTTCPSDCACAANQDCVVGVCVATCGNASCEPGRGENCSTCPGDCPCGPTQTCNAGVCEAGCNLTVVSSNPPNCAIDAGYPVNPNAPGTIYGWDSVDITVAGCPAQGLIAADFTVSTTPALPAPTITSVTDDGANTATLHLSGPIAPGGWTCFTHSGGAKVCLGFLPGDVGGDRAAAASDVLEVIDDLNGVRVPPLQPWQCDVDRSNVCNAADVLGVIDLLNGAVPFDPWNNLGIPVCPNP